MTFMPRSRAVGRTADSADTVLPVPVPASTTGLMPSETAEEMKRTSSPCPGRGL